MRRRRRRRLLFERLEEVDRHREDDGGVLLGRDLVQRLQVAQLQRRRRLVDDVGRILERARCLVLTFRRNHLHWQIATHTFTSCSIGQT